MRRRMLASLALLPALTLGIAACGNDGGGKDPVRDARNAAAKNLDKQRQFAKCMRDNGVDMDDPDPNGGVHVRVSKEAGGEDTMRNAEAKCRHLRPDGGRPKKPSAEDLAKMRAFAKCMREHGIDMPDPETDGKMVIGQRQGDSGPTPGSSEFEKAQRECAKYGPKGGPVGVGGKTNPQ